MIIYSGVGGNSERATSGQTPARLLTGLGQPLTTFAFANSDVSICHGGSFGRSVLGVLS
jgi:hypothetical protein